MLITTDQNLVKVHISVLGGGGGSGEGERGCSWQGCAARFSDPDSGTTYIAYTREYPPPPGSVSTEILLVAYWYTGQVFLENQSYVHACTCYWQCFCFLLLLNHKQQWLYNIAFKLKDVKKLIEGLIFFFFPSVNKMPVLLICFFFNIR